MTNTEPLKQVIAQQRNHLAQGLRAPMSKLSKQCALLCHTQYDLDKILQDGFNVLKHAQLLYVMDADGFQLSGNISKNNQDQSTIGQDLSKRPYLTNQRRKRDFWLTDVYISQVTERPCLTAIHEISRQGAPSCFLAADFDLSDLVFLPVTIGVKDWQQVKGDPSIRSTLFMQTRTTSPMDERLEDVIKIMTILLTERGIFHGKLHFSSSRATLWLVEDPFQYKIHVLDEIIDPSVCLAYPSQPYPERAIVPKEQIKDIFMRFATLRNVDDTIYLRSASLNIINGMVGLNFSCDGTHYMKADEFCARSEDFWVGGAV